MVTESDLGIMREFSQIRKHSRTFALVEDELIVKYFRAMSATEIAKDIVRIANTATLSKDVIDLLEKKLTLLTEEITSLRMKALHFEAENANLKTQLQRLQPAGGLEKETFDILKFFFDQGRDISIEDIARKFQFQMSIAEYHFDVLFNREFVTQTRMGIQTYGGSSPALFALTSEGRKYVMQNRT